MWKAYERKPCLFYLKMIVPVIFIFNNLIYPSKCHETGKGTKGMYCRSDSDCDQTRFLRCIGTDSTCDCYKAIGEVWVYEESSCMMKEGGPCGTVTSNAKCITNSSCITGKCECDDGFLRNGYDGCQLGYGNLCSNDDECAGRFMLECTKSEKGLSKVCKCKNEGRDFTWDEDRQKCVRHAGGQCDLPASSHYEKDDEIECIPYAECVDIGGNGVCHCLPGFTQTPDSKCKLQFGQNCDPHVGPKCNEHQFLGCQDGKCVCNNYGQMIYDTVTKQCRWLVGESCSVNRSNDKEPLCVTDSSCIPRPGYQRGTCTCLPNMEKMDDRTCSRYNKGYGLPCSASIDCDRRKFLECVSNEIDGSHCDCLQSDMYFDGNACRVRVGRSCTENKLCAENSYCEGDWCVCKQGYKISDFNCIPEVGDKARHLQNSERLDQNLIDCQAKSISHIWINEKQNCLALVGTNCSKDSECIPNAICDIQAKTCQCPASTHTTSKDRTCITRSTVDSHSVECGISTLRSVRSQEYHGLPSRANCAQSLFIVVIVSFLVNSLSSFL